MEYKIKLLIITSSFPQKDLISGVFIPDTIRELNRSGVSVHVLTQNCFGYESYTEKLWNGCSATYFGWSGGSTPLISLINQKTGLLKAGQYLAKAICTGKKICNQWSPDVILAEWLIPAGLIARTLSLITKIPYCCRALGSDVYIAAKNKIFAPVIKNIAKNSSILFADGFDLCRQTAQLAGNKECYFAATARKPESKKSSFSPLNDGALFTFCSIGRLHQVKGFDFLIKACSILREKGFNFRCYIVGAGEEKDRLRALIKDLNLQTEVILTGRLEDGDIGTLLEHVNCVVIPSLNESIPLVLSEAVNFKKPLIVTDAGDMGFLAEKYKLGYVVPSGSHEDIAVALIKMTNDNLRSSFFNEERYNELSSILSVEAGAKVIFDKIMNLKNKGCL